MKIDKNLSTNPDIAQNQKTGMDCSRFPPQNETPNSNGNNHPGAVVISIAVTTVLIVLGVGAYIFWSQGNQFSKQALPVISPVLESQVKMTGNYDVVIKEVSVDNSKSDVYLKDRSTGEETLFITLADVYREHYHSAEFHNGNLYIITRTGEGLGYQDNTDWIDVLWRYNSQKQGQKLYSFQGLDFRVSSDEKYIAVFDNKVLTLLDKQGSIVKTFSNKELTSVPEGSPSIGFLKWELGAIWLDNTSGPSLVGLIKIDLSSYDVTTYDLSNLPSSTEYDLNTKKRLLAFSDYPALFDVEGARDYEQSGKEVHLIVYDLKTKSQLQVASSVTKRFKQSWIDDATLEYDNPTGEGRLTKKF